MPNNNNDTTTKLGIDVGAFKRGLQDAARQIKLANAEFKTASASMDKWSKSTDGLQAKIKQLESVLDAENKKLELQKQRLAEVEKEQGKNSAAADEMRIAIANQEAAIAKTQKSLGYYNDQLNTLKKEEEKANSATGQLTKTIDAQQKELDELKQKYANVVVEQGKNSKEAQELAKQITNLSGDLATNKQKLADAEKAADEFDESLKDVKDDSAKASDGFTVMKGALANLVASGIKACIQGLKNLGSAAKDAFNEFDEGRKNVVKATGATGEAAKELTKSYSNVAKTVVADMGDVGSALGEVNTRFGFTGKELENAITKFMKFADITGTDATNAVKLVSRAMGDAGIKSEEYESVLDDLAIAAQASGISVDKLTDNLTKYGAPMRALGFETKEAIAIFSSWEKAGVNTEIAFSGMKAAIGKWSKAGKDAKKEFSKVLEEIGNAPDIASATGLAIEAFGQKAGPDLADAIKGGRFEFSDFMKILKGSKGTVEKTFNETQNASDKVKLAFQNMKVAAGEAVDQLLQKYGPDIAKVVNGFVPKVEKIAKKVSTTVVPVLEKVFKTAKTVASFIINNFDKIAPIVMGAVAAFSTFNAVLAISKTVTAVTTAVAGLTTGVGLATKAQTIWNAALSANPIGAVITAVAALTAAVVLLSSKQSDAKKVHEEEMAALEEERDAINSNVQAWEDLQKAQQEQIDAGMTELSYYDSLKKELETIVDRNGKVKEGYEARASFITSQLSEATGVEIEQINGVIQKYDEVKTAIDDVMKKKKAQIILDSQESLYQEAINKQTEALKGLNEMQDEYKTKKTELDTYEAAAAEAAQNFLNARSFAEATYYKMQMEQIDERIKAKNEELSTIESNYKQQEDLLSQYAYNIGQYEKNMQLAHEGNYDEMSTVTWNYVKDYQSADDAQRQMLEDSIAAEETNLALLKKLKENGHTDIYDQQIKQSEKTLEQQKKELEKYQQITKDGLKEVSVEWSNGLDTQLSELTGREIEFKDAGHGQVRMYVDGVASGKSLSRDGMAELVTETINEISLQYTHAKEAGEDLIDGVNNGIANEKKQSGVFSTIAAFGNNLLAKLKKSLQEKSPSKATDEMGQFLLVGLQGGVKKKENETVKQVSEVGENVLDAFNSGLEQGVSFDPLTDSFEDAVSNIITNAGNGILAKGTDIINDFIRFINNAVPGVDLPQLERGNLKHVNLTDALTPFNQNKKVISATANSLTKASVNQGDANNKGGNVIYNFTQNNTSPKPLNRLEIYRQTKNQLNFAQGV